MANEEMEELKARIVELFHKKKKMLSSRNVASGLGLKHSQVKKALIELVNEGTLEFVSFGGTTFIQLPEGGSEE